MRKLLLASSALLALGIGVAQAGSTNTTSNGTGVAVGVSNVPASLALDGTSNAATNGGNAGNTTASGYNSSIGDTSILKDSDNREATALGLNDNAVTNGNLLNVNSDNQVDVTTTLSSARAGGSLDSFWRQCRVGCGVRALFRREGRRQRGERQHRYRNECCQYRCPAAEHVGVGRRVQCLRRLDRTLTETFSTTGDCTAWIKAGGAVVP